VRGASTVGNVLAELRWGVFACAGPRSLATYALDVIRLRVLRLAPRLARGRLRTIRLRDGTVLSYRANRGDIRAIGEIWVHEVYRLPVSEPRPRTLVDFGANIGLASLWLARRYGCERVFAVEPDPDNARIADLNLARNGVQREVVTAAVGPADGRARFARSSDSMLGMLDEAGDVEVAVVSPAAVLARLGGDADLLKLDIEGGEEGLARADTAWLDRVRLIIGELHPLTSDAQLVVRALAERGFAVLPAGAVFPHGQTVFYRPGTDVPLLMGG
jgi:FkbM family methyltransferase